MALGVGLLSRFPLSETKSHSVYIDGVIAPRPMLEARVSVEGLPLVLFVCHWKSKLGGEDTTEGTRRASARIILRRMRELLESEPDLPVIVTGDLNENHDEFYRRSGTAISALLPDDPRSAELTGLYGLDKDNSNIAELQKDFIILSKNKPPETRYFPSGVLALYSPWDSELQDGSYLYKNAWETIDHFLLSVQLFSGTGWSFENCEVVNSPPFANTNGHPVSYNPRTGYGMSDHLPLLLTLKVN
jgi:endonuclease/exonuclease/phosphatase family metal-dependent hydrolase